MSEPGTCGEWVPHGGRAVTGSRCGRKVKAEGLCGIHLAAQRKRAANAAARAAKRRENEDRKAAAEALCERLSAVGIAARPHWAMGSSPSADRYTGGIAITDPEQAAAVVALLTDDKEG